jgi:hypothetical protein
MAADDGHLCLSRPWQVDYGDKQLTTQEIVMGAGRARRLALKFGLFENQNHGLGKLGLELSPPTPNVPLAGVRY